MASIFDSPSTVAARIREVGDYVNALARDYEAADGAVPEALAKDFADFKASVEHWIDARPSTWWTGPSTEEQAERYLAKAEEFRQKLAEAGGVPQTAPKAAPPPTAGGLARQVERDLFLVVALGVVVFAWSAGRGASK